MFALLFSPSFIIPSLTCVFEQMDLGVGSFVFSQGVVSAIPLLKDPYHLKASFLRKIINVTTKSLPIIALGLIRVLLVKGTEYPVNIQKKNSFADSLLDQKSSGTRHRIWSALELLHYTRIIAGDASLPSPFVSAGHHFGCGCRVGDV